MRASRVYHSKNPFVYAGTQTNRHASTHTHTHTRIRTVACTAYPEGGCYRTLSTKCEQLMHQHSTCAACLTEEKAIEMRGAGHLMIPAQPPEQRAPVIHTHAHTCTYSLSLLPATAHLPARQSNMFSRLKGRMHPPYSTLLLIRIDTAFPFVNVPDEEKVSSSRHEEGVGPVSRITSHTKTT